MERSFPLRTKHYILEPMSDHALQRKIVLLMGEAEEERYYTAQQICSQLPEHRPWYAPWQVQNTEGECVGELIFWDAPKHGRVTLEFRPEYQLDGDAVSEITNAAARWAFSQPDVYRVCIPIEQTEGEIRRNLEARNFKPQGTGLLGKEKPLPHYIAAHLLLGLGAGLLFWRGGISGFFLTILCMMTGICIGICLEQAERDRRSKILKLPSHEGI